MKLIYSAVLALALGAASVSSVQARDSFSVGIQIGGYGYAPPVVYYPQPVYYAQPIYYSQPVTYYRPAPRYYGYAPSVVSFGYNNGYSQRGRHDGHRGWGHERRGHGRGYDRGDGRGHGRGHHN